ncbi:MAG: T9SS type A sorting domain-containing protein [Bacteroidia bacterium]|nr:T9SS type A sorting domain-containing protein [Bacteroidia bacterium]
MCPANDAITIVSKKESESLKIQIKDITGRVVLTKNLNTNNIYVTTDLPLINGAYLILICNSTNKTVIKKLLIAK